VSSRKSCNRIITFRRYYERSISSLSVICIKFIVAPARHLIDLS
jgi:hypothetical protein